LSGSQIKPPALPEVHDFSAWKRWSPDSMAPSSARAVRAASRSPSPPEVNVLKRPGSREFAGITTHDPAGNVFDLHQEWKIGEMCM